MPFLSVIHTKEMGEQREIKMQLSNNLYSNFGRRIGPAKQVLIPGQLNKAEETAP